MPHTGGQSCWDDDDCGCELMPPAPDSMRLTDGQARAARHCERVALFAQHHGTDPRRLCLAHPTARNVRDGGLDGLRATSARPARGYSRHDHYGRHLAQLNLRRAMSPCVQYASRPPQFKARARPLRLLGLNRDPNHRFDDDAVVIGAVPPPETEIEIPAAETCIDRRIG